MRNPTIPPPPEWGGLHVSSCLCSSCALCILIALQSSSLIVVRLNTNVIHLFPAFYNITKPGMCIAQMCLLKKFSLEPCLQARTDKQRFRPLLRWWSLQAHRRGGFLGDRHLSVALSYHPQYDIQNRGKWKVALLCTNSVSSGILEVLVFIIISTSGSSLT